MPNGEFPKFPSAFTEEDLERMRELERLATEQRRAYKGLVPWRKKPTIERGIRRVAEKAYAPPKWLREITPWEEMGFTPEQADIYIRETEEELLELKRRQTVAGRLPSITDYITALAMERLLTGEEAQLYELIPELNPSAPERLNLSEEEREWFLEYSKSLVGRSREDILNIYAEGGFPAPKTIAELMELVETTFPHDPRQVYATIEFLKDSEEVEKAIRDMYPSQVDREISPADSINAELERLGLTPTGDVKKDIEALEKARAEQVKIEGTPAQAILENGEVVNVNIRGKDVLFGGQLVSHYNPETKEFLPLSTEEEYNIASVPPMGNAESRLRSMFTFLDDQALTAFRACRGDERAIAAWWKEYVAARYGTEHVNMNWVRKLAEMEAGTYEPPTGLLPELFSLYNIAEGSWAAGWGDVIATSGGVANWLGAEGIAENLTKFGNELQALSYPDTLGDFHWGMIANPRFWAHRGTRVVPFTLSLIPAAIVGYYGGAYIGLVIAGKFALGAWGTAILQAIFGGVGGATLARPMESAMEAGSAYDKAKDMGASDEEADAIAWEVFVNNLKLAGLDAIQIAAMFAPIPGAPGAALIAKGLVTTVRVGGRVVITGLTEAGEEAWQEVIIRQAMGEEVKLDAEMQQVMALGGSMGILMGAGGDVLSGILNRTKESMTPSQRETFDADVEEVGEAKALDNLAETPEGAKIVEGATKVAIEQEYNKQIKDPGKRTHTKEITFLEDQLVTLDKELAIIRDSHRVQGERLENLKEAKAPAYELTELQESIKNLQGILSELNTKKASLQSKLNILKEVEPVVEVVPERVAPEVQAETWEKMSYTSKAALADKAGIAKTAAKLSWSNLTSVQQERLSGVPVPELPPAAPEVKTPQEEVMGEGINVRAAEEQAENLEGYQEAVVTIDDVARAAREALEHIDVHFFSADGSNPLDIAATAAWKLGSIEEYVRLLPPDIYDNVSQEFKDADFADVAEWNLNSMDTIRAFSAIDRGHFGGVARRKVLSPTERLHMAYFNIYGVIELKYLKLEQSVGLDRPSWYKFRRKKKFNSDSFTLMENISQTDPNVETSELLQRDTIKEAVKDYSREQQEAMVNWAKGLRTLWDELITNQNAVRVKLGLEPIEYRDNYVSWVYEPNLWARFLGLRLKPDFVRETAVAPDFIKPTEPFVAHALAREGGLAGYTKIKDVRKLFLDYADTAARDMFFTPIVMNAKAHAYALREKGFNASSRWMLDWATESYAGMPSFVSRATRKSMFAPLRRPLISLRRNLTRAVFPLNWSWNFFVQTSSIALTVGQYGVRNTIMGSQYLWNPPIRKLINEDCFSHIIKKRAEGSIVYQDLGATISRFQYVGRTPMQTVEMAMNYLTRAIETNITGVSCYAAYREGQRKGLTGRALIDYASEGGAKTQSMYNMQNVPGTLRSPEVGAVFPFQTFCFEAMNFVRELSGIKQFKAGAYETIAADTIEGQGLVKNRVKHFLSFMAAIYVLNIIGDFAIDRRPWQPTSFIPFVGIMMSGLDPYNVWYYPMPVRYVAEFTRGVQDIIEYGNWRRLRAWTLRYHTLGGVQVSRTIDGIIASTEGREVKDVSGGVMFEFEDKPLEYMKAITMGVYQTEAGREYRERSFEGADPTTVRLIKDIVKLEEQLGDDVRGKYYTLGSYGADVLTKLKAVDIPQWQTFGEETGYPLLFQFRLYCDIMWEEYYGILGGDRLKYRKNNPYIDASLYFWEKVGTLRSDGAKDLLEGLFREFIEGNPRAHWRGLPVIPEEIKLLPE